MSPQNKTPRQTPGQGLVPLTVLIDPDVKDWLYEAAHREQMSMAHYVRVLFAAHRLHTDEES